jgi:hypothetical protein
MEGRTRPPGINKQLHTVLMDTSATRKMLRMLAPSQSIERIWTRVWSDTLPPNAESNLSLRLVL